MKKKSSCKNRIFLSRRSVLLLYVLAVGLVALLLLVGSGCAGKPIGIVGQGTFTKNGIVFSTTGNKEPVYNGQVKQNGQEQPVNWLQLGNDKVLLPGEWQPGATYQFTVDGTSWTTVAPLKPTALIQGIDSIGDLDELPTINEWNVVANESVAVSNDGQYVAAGSFDHSVYLFDRSGKKLWDYRIPSGIPVSVEFSDDNAILFVGESSPDAVVYAFETASGRVLWKYSFSDILGSSFNPQWSLRPNVRYITVNGDTVIVGGQHRNKITEKQGERAIVRYPSKSAIIAFDCRTGEKRWQYPAEGVMDSGISKIVVSADGKRVVFANQTRDVAEKYPGGCIRILNGKTGNLAAWYQANIRKPFFSWVGLNEGIDISPSGRYAAVVAGDDRVWLFDLSEINFETTAREMTPLWSRNISKIQVVGGIPIYTSGSATCVTDQGQVFFMTNSTFLADQTVASSTPFEHPDATSLFTYSLQGDLVGRWQTEGSLGKIKASVDRRYMVAGVFHNHVAQRSERAGIYCFDLQAAGEDCLLWFYPMQGVAAVADIAANGTTIAGTEIPLRMRDGTVCGEHRLHILQ